MDVAVIIVQGHLYLFIFFCDVLVGAGRPRLGRVTLVAKAVRWRQGAVKGGGRNRFGIFAGSKCGELVCVLTVVKRR